MGHASYLEMGFAVVALCAAAFNLWIFLLWRKERAHLWLSVAAIGIAALSATTGLLYQSSSLESALSIQRIQFLCALPIVVGFLRFSSHFLRTDVRRAERISWVYLALIAILEPWPGAAFSGHAKTTEIAAIGLRFVEAELTPLGNALFAGFFALVAYLIPLYVKNREHLRGNATSILVTVCLWFLCGVSDIAAATDVYEAPFLMGIGYASFLVAFTAILVQGFVRSVEQAERSAETLQKLVEERTEELRQKDLQLAHGGRMATLGTLAAGVAHEINNPIAFITSNLNQLGKFWKEEERCADVEEILVETGEGVERIRRIVSELLSLARRSDGIDERVSLHKVVDSVLPILGHVTRNRAEIHTELSPVPDVMGDEQLLGQVVLNLVLNAIQAIPEDDPGRNLVTISTAYEDGSVWLVVQDTGNGIPEEVLPRIFDPFFTTKAHGKGTGLGLAVTHQLVSRHRGRIDVESDSEGTRVTVELPPAPEGED